MQKDDEQVRNTSISHLLEITNEYKVMSHPNSIM